jgi:hypothetical protein
VLPAREQAAFHYDYQGVAMVGDMVEELTCWIAEQLPRRSVLRAAVPTQGCQFRQTPLPERIPTRIPVANPSAHSSLSLTLRNLAEQT